MIQFISIFLLMLLHPFVTGAIEGILYGRKAAESFRWDEHLMFLVGRAIIGLLVLLTTDLTIFDRIILVICWIFCYALPHDESYYYTRAKIDKSRYVYGYQSPTSTAKLELNKLERLILLLIGLAGFIVYLFLKY